MSALKLLVAILLGFWCYDSLSAADASKPQPSNFKHMLPGYCHAGTKIKDLKAPGGFATSDNLPKAIDKTIKAPKEEVYLLALPKEETTFQGKYKGLKILLINGTKKQHSFAASDSRLSILQEAKDKTGKWKAIEYLPSSFCGNSYHSVALASKEYWSFTAPRYEGSTATTLRFSFKFGKGKVLYSNEFKGSVNPKQFTTKQGQKAPAKK